MRTGCGFGDGGCLVSSEESAERHYEVIRKQKYTPRKIALYGLNRACIIGLPGVDDRSERASMYGEHVTNVRHTAV